jgi:hypothetical protein
MSSEINTSSPLMTFFSFLTTGACILFGHLVANYQNIHLPPIVIEILQSLSYAGADLAHYDKQGFSTMSEINYNAKLANGL